MNNFMKSPCVECPFRKNSLRGYTGNLDLDETISIAHSEESFQCHLTRETGKEKECAGRLLYAKSCGKMFRNPDMEAARQSVAQLNPNYREEILGFDFRKYHTLSKI